MCAIFHGNQRIALLVFFSSTSTKGRPGNWASKRIQLIILQVFFNVNLITEKTWLSLTHLSPYVSSEDGLSKVRELVVEKWPGADSPNRAEGS